MKSVVIFLTFVCTTALAGTWTSWGAWADVCTNCPGSTYRGRTRVCVIGADMSGCSGSRTEKTVCNCPLDSVWGEWEDWTVCDKDCGYCGTQTRTRECEVIDGCPAANCTGDNSESRACSTTDGVCLAPSVSCCAGYKKKVDIPSKRFYCGL
ncbi:unnamed protein product [Caenorhabditis sp. 36 PRJEB53466]|nr:unnamed protein product [Caenorhabditis sp. 36 PRJEB53466]